MNLRLLISLFLAFLVTVGLFILMPALIETGNQGLDDKPRIKLADIVMPPQEIVTNIEEKKPEKPQEPEQPPPDLAQPQMDIQFDPSRMVNVAPQQARVDISIEMGRGIAGGEGEYLPIVKVAPIYPRRAMSRGVQGHCIVEYTVTRTGATRDPFPVDCQPQGYFEQASVAAALKFKYKPRVIDGDAVDVPGVQNKFTYELER